MGRIVGRQDGKVVQVKRQTCASMSPECKRCLTVLDERMAWMSDRELITEAALAVGVLAGSSCYTFGASRGCGDAWPNLTAAEG